METPQPFPEPRRPYKFQADAPFLQQPVSDEEFRRTVIADMAQIKTALIGNDLGTPGIVPRLDIVEQKVEKHDRKLLVWGTVFTVAGGAAAWIRDIFTNGGS